MRVHGQVRLPRDDGDALKVRNVVDHDGTDAGAYPEVAARGHDCCDVYVCRLSEAGL